MPVKRYKLALPPSIQRIRKARKTLRSMSKLERIDLMVKAGSMTEQQAARAKKKLAEQPDQGPGNGVRNRVGSDGS